MDKTVVETHDEKYEAEASVEHPLDEEEDSPIEEVRVTVSSKQATFAEKPTLTSDQLL